MAIFEDKRKNIRIVAHSIEIGNHVSFGTNISISVKGNFSIDDHSRLGNNVSIRGNNVKFGKHLFHSQGLQIGGGGRQHPDANFELGDRCTIHNNFINVCEPVKIGNDVGLSQDVALITHGYWLSVLEGYPASFSGITIGDGVIIGYRTVLLMGVKIAENIVVGSNSTVTKSLDKKGIYGGTPAKFIKEIVPLQQEDRIIQVENIISNYLKIAAYHKLKPIIKIEYPWVHLDDFSVNFETMEFGGTESTVTDDFRDYIRKWGIRIYTERPFASNFSFE